MYVCIMMDKIKTNCNHLESMLLTDRKSSSFTIYNLKTTSKREFLKKYLKETFLKPQ